MSITTCPTCGEPHSWSWEEAFDKFGFGDGDGIVMTDSVVGALTRHGYEVTAEPWGSHNITICSISFNGVEQIPEDAKLGYDDPRDYLPERIIKLLDEAFPFLQEVMP
ncbi:MAG: hypothetical protein K2Y05_02475 [Hyphomicrobiaceae bacterium]|nr:hypothetical protein [Hyphomicrobiaceae bacterium]